MPGIALSNTNVLFIRDWFGISLCPFAKLAKMRCLELRKRPVIRSEFLQSLSLDSAQLHCKLRTLRGTEHPRPPRPQIVFCRTWQLKHAIDRHAGRDPSGTRAPPARRRNRPAPGRRTSYASIMVVSSPASPCLRPYAHSRSRKPSASFARNCVFDNCVSGFGHFRYQHVRSSTPATA